MYYPCLDKHVCKLQLDWLVKAADRKAVILVFLLCSCDTQTQGLSLCKMKNVCLGSTENVQEVAQKHQRQLQAPLRI